MLTFTKIFVRTVFFGFAFFILLMISLVLMGVDLPWERFWLAPHEAPISEAFSWNDSLMYEDLYPEEEYVLDDDVVLYVEVLPQMDEPYEPQSPQGPVVQLFWIPREAYLLSLDGEVLAILEPQEVEVIFENNENGKLVRTGEGVDGWLDMSFPPTAIALDRLAFELSLQLAGSSNISIWYENMETGWYWSHDDRRVYFAASILKALFAMELYMRAERGELNTDTRFVFREQDSWEAPGFLHWYNDIGRYFAVRDLIRWNVSHSDCSATRILARNLGVDGVRYLAETLGAERTRIGNVVVNSEVSARDAGLFMRAIYEFIKTDTFYAQELHSALKNNRNPFIASGSGYPIASKTGWTRMEAWHDTAIVYAESPFVLVILTDRHGWSDRDFADFARITEIFENFNRYWFSW